MYESAMKVELRFELSKLKKDKQYYSQKVKLEKEMLAKINNDSIMQSLINKSDQGVAQYAKAVKALKTKKELERNK
jgi:hypothetical protein